MTNSSPCEAAGTFARRSVATAVSPEGSEAARSTRGRRERDRSRASSAESPCAGTIRSPSKAREAAASAIVGYGVDPHELEQALPPWGGDLDTDDMEARLYDGNDDRHL